MTAADRCTLAAAALPAAAARVAHAVARALDRLAADIQGELSHEAREALAAAALVRPARPATALATTPPPPVTPAGPLLDAMAAALDAEAAAPGRKARRGRHRAAGVYTVVLAD